ncbi:Peptidyl-prolyl cis-trans isomerase pin4 [Dispira simplex]|nr:Peptidyl-prolyl cis-trans isomerase pin4 [Dispira simplex]
MSPLQDIHEGLETLSLNHGQTQAAETTLGNDNSGNSARCTAGSRPMSVHFPTTEISTTLGSPTYPSLTSAGSTSAALAAGLSRAAAQRDKRRSMHLPLTSPLSSQQLYQSQLQQQMHATVTSQGLAHSNQTVQFPVAGFGPTTALSSATQRSGRSRPPSKSMSLPLRSQALPMMGGVPYLRHNIPPLHSPSGVQLGGAANSVIGHPTQLPGYMHRVMDLYAYNRAQALAPQPAPDEIPTAVVIKNIAFAIKREVLLQVIASLDIPIPYALNYHYEGGVFRGLAFANFRTPEETMLVMATLNGFDLAGRKLKVEYKRMLPADQEAAKQEARLARRNSTATGAPPANLTGGMNSARNASEVSNGSAESSPNPGQAAESVNGSETGGIVSSPGVSINLDNPQVRETYDQIAAFRHDKTRRTLDITLPDTMDSSMFPVVRAIAERFGLQTQKLPKSQPVPDSPSTPGKNASDGDESGQEKTGNQPSPTSPSSSPRTPSSPAVLRLAKPADTARPEPNRVRHNRYSVSGLPTSNVSYAAKQRGRLSTDIGSAAFYQAYAAGVGGAHTAALYGNPQLLAHSHLGGYVGNKLGYPYGTQPNANIPTDAYLMAQQGLYGVPDDYAGDAVMDATAANFTDGRAAAAGRLRSMSLSVTPRGGPVSTGSTYSSGRTNPLTGELPTRADVGAGRLSGGSPSTPTSSSPAANNNFQGYPTRMFNSAVVVPSRQPRGPEMSQNFVSRFNLLQQANQAALGGHGSHVADDIIGNTHSYYASATTGSAGAYV